MKLILLTICYLHLVITKHYLVKTRDQGITNKQTYAGDDYVVPLSLCGQPKGVVGLCRALLPRWTYDQHSRKCDKFYYGGCGGNRNNFKNKQECDNVCRTGSNGCFGPTSTVETRSGVKAITELSIGDQIRTASDNMMNTSFTEFLGWLDREEVSPVKMLQLFTSSNYPAITLTASHLVFTSNTTKYAGDLVPGDTLLQWDGVEMVELEISMIKTSKEAGYWAPLTRAGTLLVNNLLVSCYASYPHTLSDIAMTPIKAMSMTLLDNEESQHNDGVRKVITLMKGIGQLFGTRKEEDVSENFPMNVGIFANDLHMKYEF